MTDKEIKSIKEKIEKDIEKLNRLIEETLSFSDPVEPDNAIGRISRMDAINNKTIFDASLKNNKDRLASLQVTLNNLQSKDFGICRKCKKPIPIERLMIRPEVDLCANCK
jgi:DnaK suppressor protein